MPVCHHNSILPTEKETQLERKIKVHVWGRNDTEIREVGLAEAEKMLNETYADPIGGLVVNQETGEVIAEISPEIKEILIIDQMIGGG
jgi:hypothetical protein